MSEYQYYEFQAIDRPLAEKEMDDLRSYSTRARITPTSFVNDYSWGNFKGDEDKWMERYFDAFLYLANWGTHVLKLRLPSKLLSAGTAKQYCAGSSTFVREKQGKIIITFASEDEDGGDWVEGEGRLSSLIPIRAELARGDLRALYLGWLLRAQGGELQDETPEPPVPPNLGSLSASLRSLTEFLRIDEELLAVAAQGSARTQDKLVDRAKIGSWLGGLPSTVKDEILARLIVDGDAQIQNELLARYEQDSRDHSAGDTGVRNTCRRTVAELLATAEQNSTARRDAAARRAAEEKARREQETAMARVKHLDTLAGRESKLWADVEQLVSTKQPRNYDLAVEQIIDLRDLAARKSNDSDFKLRVENLRTLHALKSTFIERLRKAML